MSLKSAHTSRPPTTDLPYRCRVLPSGLTLVEVHQPHLHRGAVSVFFRAGSRYENPTQNGISHFLEHMMFRGTSGFATTYAQNLAIERLGGMLFAATAADCTEFEITLPSETLAEGTRLLATILTEPLFKDIDIERKVIAEEVLEDVGENGGSIDIDFLSRQRLWPHHPLGQSIAGPLENIETFSTADIVEHFHRSYVAENAIVCLSGGFDESLPTVAAEAFSLFSSGGVTPLSVPPELHPGPSIQHIRKPGSQTQLRLAFHAPGESSPFDVPLLILLGVLDDGMSTRLHRRIFDERGLAYNVSAGLESYHDVAAFNFDVTASHRNTVEVTRQLLILADELRREAVGRDELEKAKRRAIWALDDYLDDPHGMAAWYGEQALFRPPPSLDDRKAAYLAVTRSDILAVAKDVFRRENLHLTTVGGVTRQQKREIAAVVDGFD